MSKVEWGCDLVERPFSKQMKAMGWQRIAGNNDLPDFTERANFRDIVNVISGLALTQHFADIAPEYPRLLHAGH